MVIGITLMAAGTILLFSLNWWYKRLRKKGVRIGQSPLSRIVARVGVFIIGFAAFFLGLIVLFASG